MKLKEIKKEEELQAKLRKANHISIQFKGNSFLKQSEMRLRKTKTSWKCQLRYPDSDSFSEERNVLNMQKTWTALDFVLQNCEKVYGKVKRVSIL